MKKIITLVFTLILINGCAVHKEWGTSGGSKADGIVELSFTLGSFEKPEIDNEKGVQKAIKMCQTWGYNDAQEFDFINRVCNARDFSGSCTSTLITKKFQCIN